MENRRLWLGEDKRSVVAPKLYRFKTLQMHLYVCWRSESQATPTKPESYVNRKVWGGAGIVDTVSAQTGYTEFHHPVRLKAEFLHPNNPNCMFSQWCSLNVTTTLL